MELTMAKQQRQLTSATEVLDGEIDLPQPARISLNESRKLELLGAIKGLAHAANSLTAQAMHCLCAVQEQEFWRDIPFDDTRNCANFNEFLSVHGPFGKSKFYEMKDLLDKEGSATFDTLTALGISYERRKLLQPGSIGVDGDEVVIDNERVPISNARRIKTILATLTEKIAKQDDQIAAGEQTVRKLKDRVREAEVRAAATVTIQVAWDVRLTEALVALGSLATALAEAPVTAEQRKLISDRLTEQMRQVTRALGISDEDEFDDDDFDLHVAEADDE
jgi:hypothetical protein